ncbi:DUF3710 domain-containing protein [Streptomyces sp. NPDC055815]
MGEHGTIDLGGMRLPRRPIAELRFERARGSSDPVAVTVVRDRRLAVQLQAFHASAAGEGAGARDRFARNVRHLGGTAEERPGPCGTELICVVPSIRPDGTSVDLPVRVLWREAPGWLLRALVSGPDREPVPGGDGEDWAHAYVAHVVVDPSYGPKGLDPSPVGFGPPRPVGPIPLRPPTTS